MFTKLINQATTLDKAIALSLAGVGLVVSGSEGISTYASGTL